MTFDQIWQQFQGAIVVAIAGAVIAGITFLVKWFIGLGNKVEKIVVSLDALTPIVVANFNMMKPMFEVNRTLIEVTAENKINGNVEKAHKALKTAESLHDQVAQNTMRQCVDDCLTGGDK